MTILFLWALACLVADRLMTVYAVEHMGARERNPLVRLLARALGWPASTILCGTAYLGVVLYLLDRGVRLPVIIILALYTLVCAWNAYQVISHKLDWAIFAAIFGRKK